jgi:hypothetical protein
MYYLNELFIINSANDLKHSQKAYLFKIFYNNDLIRIYLILIILLFNFYYIMN